ncbi:MAG: hypothetical protein CMM93_02740 [Rickettsiales bacterium]|nr:hypothetical protein [Rickettsiales bacterium]
MLTQEYHMPETGSAPMPPIAASNDNEVIDTRFGKVTLNRKNPVVFPNGLLGFPDKFQYCLTTFPAEKLAKFKLLQSLEDTELSFITLPLELDNKILERADIELGCKDLDIPLKDLTLLLIVTVHRMGDHVRLSVNARAPLFVHAEKRVASQYVFHNPKYDIQHMITL